MENIVSPTSPCEDPGDDVLTTTVDVSAAPAILVMTVESTPVAEDERMGWLLRTVAPNGVAGPKDTTVAQGVLMLIWSIAHD